MTFEFFGEFLNIEYARKFTWCFEIQISPYIRLRSTSVFTNVTFKSPSHNSGALLGDGFEIEISAVF